MKKNCGRILRIIFLLSYFIGASWGNENQSFLEFHSKTVVKHQVYLEKGQTLSEMLYNRGFRKLWGKFGAVEHTVFKSGLAPKKLKYLPVGQKIILPDPKRIKYYPYFYYLPEKNKFLEGKNGPSQALAGTAYDKKKGEKAEVEKTDRKIANTNQESIKDLEGQTPIKQRNRSFIPFWGLGGNGETMFFNSNQGNLSATIQAKSRLGVSLSYGLDFIENRWHFELAMSYIRTKLNDPNNYSLSKNSFSHYNFRLLIQKFLSERFGIITSMQLVPFLYVREITNFHVTVGDTQLTEFSLGLNLKVKNLNLSKPRFRGAFPLPWQVRPTETPSIQALVFGVGFT